MFMGRFMEDHIAELWSFWDGDTDSMMANFTAGTPVRKCRKQNAFIINPQFPHLFASVDRIINKGDNGKEGILEIKTISGFASDMWIAGIPPQYIVQLQQYLLVTGLEYGEMAILKEHLAISGYAESLIKSTENIIEFTNTIQVIGAQILTPNHQEA